MRLPPPNGLPYHSDLIDYMDMHMHGMSDAIDVDKSDENWGTQ
jgi:hypothetical protein